MREQLAGADYVAGASKVTLRTVVDGAQQWTVLAPAGGTCERVPAASLTWLIEQGHVLPRCEVEKAGARCVLAADHQPASCDFSKAAAPAPARKRRAARKE